MVHVHEDVRQGFLSFFDGTSRISNGDFFFLVIIIDFYFILYSFYLDVS
jgi:hypothetical protein